MIEGLLGGLQCFLSLALALSGLGFVNFFIPLDECVRDVRLMRFDRAHHGLVFIAGF